MRTHLAALAVIPFALAACTLGDRDSFAVRFQNDLGRPVVVALCHSDHSRVCRHAYYRDRIEVGKSTEENIAPDVRTEWALETPSGKLLRCVVLYWKDDPGHTQVVRASDAPRWTWPCARMRRQFRLDVL